MVRRVFYSFHYEPDSWRAGQVRGMGVIEGNAPVSDNDWEAVTRGGDAAIQEWIEEQMSGKSCVVVLIGTNTASRKWVKYEIRKAWHEGKGVLGVYVHNLKDSNGNQAAKGANPFDAVPREGTNMMLSSVVEAYDPPFTISKYVYNYIKENLADWVERAIARRAAL
uniref:Thoeris protein ThsB TIR-like domain-containing protein n=1 Tax=candidate division WOR-3 bacterium TaxID=2052148 RepID=A0A7C4CE08_UNCW3